jgi:hypothetical protein
MLPRLKRPSLFAAWVRHASTHCCSFPEREKNARASRAIRPLKPQRWLRPGPLHGCNAALARLKIEADAIDECKALTDAAGTSLEGMTGVDAEVHSEYYAVLTALYKVKARSVSSARSHATASHREPKRLAALQSWHRVQITGPPTAFYKSALLFLSYTPLENMPKRERVRSTASTTSVRIPPLPSSVSGRRLARMSVHSVLRSSVVRCSAAGAGVRHGTISAARRHNL